MLKHFFLLIIFLASNVFAGYDISNLTTFITDYPVYVYGDVTYISDVFNAIASIVHSNDVAALASFGFIVLAFVSGWNVWKLRTLTPALKNFTFLFGASLFFLVPSVSVHIMDARVDRGVMVNGPAAYDKVDGVPVVLALAASASTSLSKTLTDIADASFAPIDIENISYAAMGYAGPINLAKELMTSTSFPASDLPLTTKFAQDIKIYSDTCLMYNLKIDKTGNAQLQLLNPKTNWFDANSPTSLGIASNLMLDPKSGQEFSCGDWWNNNIAPNMVAVGDALLAQLQSKNPHIDYGLAKEQLSQTMGLADYTTAIGSIGNLEQALLNVAVEDVVLASLNQNGVGLTAFDVANSLNLKSAKANVQSTGLAQFQWLSAMLPHILHFLEGVIYSAGVFMLLFAIYMGADTALLWIRNYIGGLIVFETSKVALAIANNLVLHYSQNNAITLLTIKNNPFSIMGMPEYLDYLATMTGVAGIMGVASVTLIPGIIFGGKVASALGNLNGMQGMLNAQLQAARQLATLQKAGNDIQKETGMSKGALESYQQYQNDIESASSSYANRMNMVRGGESNQYKQLSRSAQNTAASNLGSKMAAGDKSFGRDNFYDSGYGSGLQNTANSLEAGYAANNTLSSAPNMNSYRLGAAVNATKSINTQMGAGDAILSGKTTLPEVASTSRASGQVGTMAGVAEGRANKALLNGDKNFGFDKNSFNDFITGKERETAKTLGKSVGSGRADVSGDSFSKSISAATGQFEESFRSDAGYVKEAMKNGHITENRGRAVETLSAAKVAGETEGVNRKFDKGYNPIEMAKQAARVAADQEIGKYDASVINQKKFGDGVYQKTAASSELNQVAGAMGSIKQAGGIQALASLMQVQGAANTAGLQGSIRGAGGAGAYIDQAGDAAAKQSSSTAATLSGERKEGLIGNDGTLTKKGFAATEAMASKAAASTIKFGSIVTDSERAGNMVAATANQAAQSAAATHLLKNPMDVQGALKAAQQEADKVISDAKATGMLDAKSRGVNVKGIAYNKDSKLIDFDIDASGVKGAGNWAGALGRAEGEMVTGLKGVSIGGYTVKDHGGAVSVSKHTGSNIDSSRTFNSSMNINDAQTLKDGVQTDPMSMASFLGGHTGELAAGALLFGAGAIGLNKAYGNPAGKISGGIVDKLKDWRHAKKGDIKGDDGRWHTPIQDAMGNTHLSEDTLPKSQLKKDFDEGVRFTPNGDGTVKPVKFNSEEYADYLRQGSPSFKGDASPHITPHTTAPTINSAKPNIDHANISSSLSFSSSIIPQGTPTVNHNTSMLSHVSSYAHSAFDFAKSHISDATHYLSRKIPGGIGTAITAGFAAEQAYSGDKIGAAMTAASGAASAIPVAGTFASLAIDGAQGIMQATGVMGRLNSMFDSHLSSFGSHAPQVSSLSLASTMTPSGPQFVSMPALTNPGVLQTQQLSALSDMKQALNYANQSARATQNKTYEATAYQADIARTLEKILKKDEV